MSKTDVKAHTDGNVAGNQWALIATETWQLNKLGTGEVPFHTSGCFLPTEPYPIQGTLQLDSADCFRVQAHVNECTGSRLCEGNGPLYTAQVILLPAEASLKPISCGIVNSFRSIKGPMHRRTDLFSHDAVAHFLKCLNYRKEEMLQKCHAEGTFRILSFSIILDVEASVFLHKEEDGEHTSGIQPRFSPHQRSSFIFGDRSSFSSMTHLCW